MKKLKIQIGDTPGDARVVIEENEEEIADVERVEIYVNKAGAQQETMVVLHVKNPTIEALISK